MTWYNQRFLNNVYKRVALVSKIIIRVFPKEVTP